MDPVTLAGIVGGLVVQAFKTFGTKAAGSAATEAGKSVAEAGASLLRRLVDRIRERFSDQDDTRGITALEHLADDPDSKGWKEDLETAIGKHVEDAAFAGELIDLVNQAREAGLIAGGDVIQQHAIGDDNIQVGKQEGGSITINKAPRQ